MAADKAFFDTNVLIYAFSARDPRQNKALDLLLAGGAISVQTLNEFLNVVISKMKTPWPDAMTWVETILELCLPPVPITIGVHRHGVRIACAHGYHIYDSLMLAAALEASCTVFYSEDLHDGQMIESLAIRNPFGRRSRHKRD
jgi:predicted nucleic acid-binding protein